MQDLSSRYGRRVASLRLRIDELSSLRAVVGLPPRYDITSRQWSVLGLQLSAVEQRLRSRLDREADAHFADLAGGRRLNAALGELELELSKAYAFFDTYMDVLTQRHTPTLGRMLAGCDVLAWSALNREHPALRLIEPPLVYCDRGFGASIIRERVSTPGGGKNPMPLIQIPYSRLKEKANLTSIVHEAGHEVLVRLGLTRELPRVLRAAASGSRISADLPDLFALWSSEIGPDFWTFCGAGFGAAGAMREILALPSEHAFRISWTDPHPPPYLRVRLVFEFCRQQWGRGPWDAWEKEWTNLYPLEAARPEARKILMHGVRLLPRVANALFTTRFRALRGRRIPDLWELSALAPAAIDRIIATAPSGFLRLTGLCPCGHLAVFRALKERGELSEEALDALMTRWLVGLGERRPH